MRFFSKVDPLHSLALFSGRYVADAAMSPSVGEPLVPFGVEQKTCLLTGTRNGKHSFLAEGEMPGTIDYEGSAWVLKGWFEREMYRWDACFAVLEDQGEGRYGALVARIASIKHLMFGEIFTPYRKAERGIPFALCKPRPRFARLSPKGGQYKSLQIDEALFLASFRQGVLAHPLARARVFASHLG